MNDSFKHSWQVYRRLLAYIQRYWKVLILSLISMTIAALTEAAFARPLKPLIHGGFVSKDPNTIRWVPLAIIGVFMLRGLTSFINEYTASWLTGRLVQTLREEMFAKLLRLPVSFYDESQSGRLISRIANDVNQVTEAGFNVITVAVKDGAVSVTQSIFYPQVKTLHLDLRAREGVNNNAKGASLATVVRIYQLKDRQAFDNTDYPSLFAGDGQVLQADRVAEKDVRLRPGESVTVDMPMETSAQFVAVAAMFIDPDLTQNSWRLVLTRDDLDPARPRIIEASQNQLTLHPFKEK